jgi:hypothetical protein
LDRRLQHVAGRTTRLHGGPGRGALRDRLRRSSARR